MSGRGALRRTVGLVALAALTASGAVGPSPSAWAGATVVAGGPLPALMMQTTDLRVVSQYDGSRQLRFSTTIGNRGPGRLVIAANRPTSADPWDVVQEVLGSEGAVVARFPLNVQPVWAGDGHNHWHVPDIADYRLLRASDASVVGTNHKIGFCLFDKMTDASPTPSRREFPDDLGCARGDQQATKVRMGLSVGWSDIYWWATPGQSIDLTGLPDGDYRLVGKVDGADALHQVEPADDVDEVDFRLTGNATAAPSVTELGGVTAGRRSSPA